MQSPTRKTSDPRTFNRVYKRLREWRKGRSPRATQRDAPQLWQLFLGKTKDEKPHRLRDGQFAEVIIKHYEQWCEMRRGAEYWALSPALWRSESSELVNPFPEIRPAFSLRLRDALTPCSYGFAVNLRASY